MSLYSRSFVGTYNRLTLDGHNTTNTDKKSILALRYVMFKTSKTIIIVQLDLSLELFIIMMLITKGERHRITYLRQPNQVRPCMLGVRRIFRGDGRMRVARSDFNLGYMNACKF